MKVKTRLYLSSIISVCLVGILILVMIFTSRTIAQKEREHMVAMNIKTAVSELDIITYEYLIYHERRMEEQWKIKYDFMAGFFSEESGTEAESLKLLRADYVLLNDLFSQITVNYGKKQELIQTGADQTKIDAAEALEERLVARLLITSQSIIVDGSRLEEGAHANEDEAQELANNLALALMLVLVLNAIITAFLITGIISKSLDKLTKGAGIIGRGDLKHRIDIKSKDELGQLATTFNEMTADLRESRNKLKKYADELDHKVNTRTKELQTRNQELKKISAELLEAKTRVETILLGIGDGVFVVDEDYNIIIFNKIAAELSGYSPKEAIGRKYGEVLNFVYEDGGRVNNHFIKECISEGRITEMANHTILIKKDGSKIPVADSAAPLKDESGKVFGCVVVFRDITQAREVDRMKSEFVSLASHQLRTPLTAIKLFIEMLANGDVGKLNKEQAEYADNIKKSNVRMIQLVNDILNVCRLESGGLRIEPVPTQMEDFISDIIKEAKSSDEKHKPTIVFHKPKTKLPEIPLDQTLMRQVIHNFITNAIRYCRPKHCRVEVELKQKDGTFQVSVKDNGIGIPKDEQAKIFGRFFRARNAVALETSGTGLGLYFARMITETAGGRIWFESDEGKGTTFYVTIPAKGMKRRGGEKGLAV